MPRWNALRPAPADLVRLSRHGRVGPGREPASSWQAEIRARRLRSAVVAAGVDGQIMRRFSDTFTRLSRPGGHLIDGADEKDGASPAEAALANCARTGAPESAGHASQKACPGRIGSARRAGPERRSREGRHRGSRPCSEWRDRARGRSVRNSGIRAVVVSNRTKRLVSERVSPGAAVVGIGQQDRLEGDLVEAGFEIPHRNSDRMPPDDVASRGDRHRGADLAVHVDVRSGCPAGLLRYRPHRGAEWPPRNRWRRNPDGRLTEKPASGGASGEFLCRHAQIREAEGLATQGGGDLGPVPGGRIDMPRSGLAR